MSAPEHEGSGSTEHPEPPSQETHTEPKPEHAEHDVMERLTTAVEALTARIDAMAPVSAVTGDNGPGLDNGPEHTPWTHKHIF